jgi:hypothetical protein
MAKIYNLTSSRKMTPKKETIDFLLEFSRSHTSLKTKKRKRYMVCNN